MKDYVRHRKHISWKTRCASALLQAGHIPYGDAKLMTEDQFLSLFHFDHNILHSTGHLDADKFWNLAPMLIKAHREKTKTDAKVIAKSRRIRAKSGWYKKVGTGPYPHTEIGFVISVKDSAGSGKEADRASARLGPAPPLRIGPDEEGGHFRRTSIPRSSGPHKIRSRGFDKRFRRKMSGKVVKREG